MDPILIKQIYRSLPDKLSGVVGTPETAQIIDEIAKRHLLTTEQRCGLGDEITTLLIGITRQSDFPEVLKNRLQITAELLQPLLDDINVQIISKIGSQTLKAQEEYAHAKLNSSNLPMVEEGEVAHDTTPEERTVGQQPASTAPAPKALQGVIEEALIKQKTNSTMYPQGRDPYREPLE